MFRAHDPAGRPGETGITFLFRAGLLVWLTGCWLCAAAQAPPGLSLDEAYRLARENYPLTRQRGLIEKTRDYSVENAGKGHLPSLSFAGQATYQSDVTSFPVEIPVPGFSFPAFSKDQYKLYGQIDQVVYDGGLIRNQKKAAEVSALVQEQNLEVELNVLYDRVNQLFFGILLLDEQLEQNGLLKKDIRNGIDKTEALIANGMAYNSSAQELQAQLLQADQSRISLATTRKAYVDMLGLLINRPLNEEAALVKPERPVLTDSISRPELLLYDYQKRTYDLQDQLLNAQLRPRFDLFVQGGYGRPALNFLSNDFNWYYLGGLRMNWNLGGLYSLKNKKQLSLLNRRTLDVQKETFLFNTRLSRRQQHAEILKYLDLMKTDESIIALRASVKEAAAAQLENGVLNAHDYLTQVIAEDQARQNLILHEIQLLQAQYNDQYLTGNH